MSEWESRQADRALERAVSEAEGRYERVRVMQAEADAGLRDIDRLYRRALVFRSPAATNRLLELERKLS